MEAPPPSYIEATSIKPLTFVADYLQTRDLCAAVLTCRSWNDALLPTLWRNPTYHFTGREESIYAPLTHFRRILPHVRLSVRALVHTLDLPRASADADYSLHPEWLRNIIYYLPRLQSLMVSGLPFFDHASIASLTQSVSRSASAWYNSSLGTNLRLLKIYNCKNATPLAISSLIEVLPLLVYIDFSCTPAARDRTVLRKLSLLPLLRVLILGYISLTDEDLESLANTVGHTLKCLDVQGNKLTSNATKPLLQMMLNDEAPHQSPPSYQTLSRHRQTQADTLQWEELEKHVYESLTSSSSLCWTIEGVSDSGLTHLRIARNGLTLTAILLLLSRGRLCVLDAGDQVNMSFQVDVDAGLTVSMGTDECLNSLKSLRAPHSLITRVLTDLRYQEIHAADLSRLRSLILTGVPSRASDDRIAHKIIAFITECAQESWTAQMRARLDYTLPPSRSHRSDVWTQHARQHFALLDITLEMAPVVAAHLSPHMKVEGWNFVGGSRSMTEDADSESLWKAAASDFSFFGSEDQGPQSQEYITMEQESSQDVVAAIASFRKSCKVKYDRARASGEQFPKIEGYWDGKVKIIRNS